MLLLIDAAKAIGKADELLAAADQVAKDKIENAETFRILAYVAVGQGAAIEADVKKYADAVHKRLTDKAPPRPSSRYYGGDDRGPVPFRASELFFAERCLADPALAKQGERLLKPLLDNATSVPHKAVGSLRELQDRLLCQRHQAPDAAANGVPAGWNGDKAEGRWLAQDGLLIALGGDGGSRLTFDMPLTGTFELSLDFRGDSQQSTCWYGGLLYNPFSQTIYDGVSNVSREIADLRADQFNTLTLKVSPKKITASINGKLWYEDDDPAPTSPWIELTAFPGNRPVFRNISVTGTPEVPAEIKLIEGDYLEGWSGLVSGILPSRIGIRDRKEQEKKGLDRYGRPLVPNPDEPKPVYDWEAKGGELHGRILERPNEAVPVPSHLGYTRPLRAGESVAWEFFHKAGASHVDPCLGRLAFLIEPDGIKWHWILHGEDTSDAWLDLPFDNAIPAPPVIRRRSPRSRRTTGTR